MMQKATFTIEIWGLISLITFVMLLSGVLNNFENRKAEIPQIVISGSLG
jgi:hypothetical protein